MMDNDQLDREIVRTVMGWKLIRQLDHHEWLYQDHTETHIRIPTDFHPTTDISQAFQVEDRIKKLDLSYIYGEHLMQIIIDDYTEVVSEKYLLAHATPLQRCQAALKAVKVG